MSSVRGGWRGYSKGSSKHADRRGTDENSSELASITKQFRALFIYRFKAIFILGLIF